MEKIATFAERLNAQISEKHLTLAELGRLAHVDRSLMTKYCHGACYPKIDTLRRLAAVLYVNPEWLEGYDVEKIPRPVNLSPLENDMLIGFRSCSSEDKLFLLEYIKKRQV